MGPDFLLFLYCTTMWGPTLSHEAGINFSASAKGWDSILHTFQARTHKASVTARPCRNVETRAMKFSRRKARTSRHQLLRFGNFRGLSSILAFLRASMSPWLDLTISRQPQLCRNPLHRLNTKRDMLFQIDAQIGCAVDDVIAIHAAGKGFVLHFFAHGLRFHLRQ
jgi:hypothetical protein